VWLAADLEAGMALYANTRWGNAAERWDAAREWLALVLPDSRAIRMFIGAVREHGTLVSLALEGRTPADARAKVYWRLRGPTSLRQMGVPLLTHRAFEEFLTLIPTEEEIPLSGIVLSAGFSVSDGALSDAKIDICAHCVVRSGETWIQFLGDCCRIGGLRPLDLGEGLRRRDCEVALVGLGLNSRSERRLNVYLKGTSGK
jgi:hypothetical protein